MEPDATPQLENLLSDLPLHRPPKSMDERMSSLFNEHRPDDAPLPVETKAAAETPPRVSEPAPAGPEPTPASAPPPPATPEATRPSKPLKLRKLASPARPHQDEPRPAVIGVVEVTAAAIAMAACLAIGLIAYFVVLPGSSKAPESLVEAEPVTAEPVTAEPVTAEPGEGAANHEPDTTRFEPVVLAQSWADVDDAGIVQVDTGLWARSLTYSQIDHVEMVDDDRQITIQWTLPREEVVYIPIGYD